MFENPWECSQAQKSKNSNKTLEQATKNMQKEMISVSNWMNYPALMLTSMQESAKKYYQETT